MNELSFKDHVENNLNAFNDKPCETCGKIIQRKKRTDGNWESPKAAAKRDFCSPACVHESLRGKVKGESVSRHGSDYVPYPEMARRSWHVPFN